MTIAEFRLRIAEYRRHADEEGRALKDTYLALERLHSLYRQFDARERELADQVFSEWVVSDDANVRFDALALVDDFSIVRAIPSLRDLARRLVSSTAPSAPYELTKVRRVIDDLTAAGQAS